MAMFEAPVAHEAIHYSNPYSNPEFEFEEELSHYSNPEVSHYSNPYSNPEFEDEIGRILGTPGLGEYEADQFFGRIRRAIGKVARIAGPLARRLAPFAARALAGMIPGVGAIAGPLAGKLVGALVREAEMEVAQMENQLLSMLSQTGEAEHPEVHEALMAELMAGNAAAAESEDEAEAMLAATIPMTIRFMRAQRTMLPVTPALVQANARLVRTLRRQGPGGRQVL